VPHRDMSNCSETFRISIFDRAYVHTGKQDREYSRMRHRVFDSRQEAHY